MMRVWAFLRDNRIYVALALFILLMHGAYHAAVRHQEEHVPAQEERVAEEVAPGEDLTSPESIERRQQELMRLAEEDRFLFAGLVLLNLLLMLGFLGGIGLDGYLIVRRYRAHKPPPIEKVPGVMPGWSLSDVIKVVIIFVALGYFLAMFVNPLLAMLVPLIHNEHFRMVFSTALVNVLGIGVIWYFVARRHSNAAEALGLKRQGWLKNVGYGLAGYLAIIPPLALVMFATYHITRFFGYSTPAQPIVQMLVEEEKAPVLWFSMVFAAVLGPVVEEVFFRGFMYPALRKRIGALWGVVLSALLFSVVHAHVAALAPIFVLGVLLAYIYERTGSLVGPIVVHISHNFFMLLLVLLTRLTVV